MQLLLFNMQLLLFNMQPVGFGTSLLNSQRYCVLACGTTMTSWFHLQVLGLGTALRLLYAPNRQVVQNVHDNRM